MWLCVLSGACGRAPSAEPDDRKSSVAASVPPRAPSASPPVAGASGGASAQPSASSSNSAAPACGPRCYRWLSAKDPLFPAAVDDLQARFPTPPGYQRVAVEQGSFSEWLRRLPLAAPGTPVVTNAGGIVFSGDDEYLAAVVAIDVGVGDLQQSADAVVRLNAEWLWSQDALGRISYRSASKLDMPFTRWAKGQRLIASGPNVFWVLKGKPRDATYVDFRQYIDAVMLWTNNVSLAARSTRVVNPNQLVAGDFFLQSRGKGHAILVLDVAEKPTGERVALLGQALQSPAQSFQVIRPGRETAWFSLRPPSTVVTPRSDQFSWDELERLEPKREN